MSFSIVQDSPLLPPVGFGPCLSPNVADHPLKSAIDHSLGRPLPHQQTNQVQAHPMVRKAFSVKTYPVLAQVSSCYSELKADTYMLLTRLPLSIATSFDLHVLGVPPRVLSHDQTLKFKNGAH